MKVLRLRRLLTIVLVISMVISLGGAVMAQAGEKVNINKATVEELVVLKGVGPKIAERIVEYRNSNRFDKIEEIMQVKGIGPKTFEIIKEQITVD